MRQNRPPAGIRDVYKRQVDVLQQASQDGDLYVGIGSDATYLEYKHRKPMCPQEERLFMVKNIKAVKDAYILSLIHIGKALQ